MINSERNFPRILIFDYDGVIADSLEIYSKLFVEVCKKYGFKGVNSKEEFISLFDKNLYESMMEMGVKEEDIKRILEDKRFLISKNALKPRIFDGIKKVMERLSISNNIFIITSNISPVVKEFLDENGMDFYEEVLGADRGLSKVTKINLIKSNYVSNEIFYIGDTKGDILEGKSAGVKTIAITWGWHSLEKLKECNPDFIVNNPVELLRWI